MDGAAHALEAGRKVFVQYAEDLPLWHARILLARAPVKIVNRVLDTDYKTDAEFWWILTPDGDIYPEPLKDIEGLFVLGDSEVIPARARGSNGRRLAQIYDFDEERAAGRPSAVTVARAMAAAADESGVAARAEGLVLPPAGADTSWRAIGASGKTARNAEIPALDQVLYADNDFAVGELEGERLALQKIKAGKDAVEVDKADDDLDARVMEIGRTGDGARHREFREAVTRLIETEWVGWPVSGPRTFLWCMRFISESDLHPRARHLRWKAATGLGSSDPGVAEHEMIMRVIELMLCYDQLQGGELASMEMLVRKAQMIELKHRDRVLAAASGAIDDDEHLYLGTGRTRGLLMIAPALEEFVSGELGKEAAAAKERRKMREERGLAKPSPTPSAGGGGHKK